MSRESGIVFKDAVNRNQGDLPKIVYHSSQFPMGGWGDLMQQCGFSSRCIHSLTEIFPNPEELSVVLLDASLAHEEELHAFDVACRNRIPVSILSVISTDDGTQIYGETSELASGVLQIPTTGPALAFCLNAAFRNSFHRYTAYRNERLRETFSRNLDNLTQIGIALSAEQNNYRLLDLILTRSRELTNADAGSIYLIEEVHEGEKKLRFKHTQNDSKTIPFKEFVMPVSKASIAGHVAVTGETLNISDVYRIPEGVEYDFNRSFDQSFGYRSKSMLVVPMKDHNNEITGVLQLINAKESSDIKLLNPDTAEREVINFDPAIEHIILSLASQAAVSLEKTMLLESIENTFEGLVKASVHAIEQRDPITSGHSERVTELTCALARAVSEWQEGRYAEVTFTDSQMKELRYAGLLHDFGKIGVKEQVLQKERKLYPLELELIKNRFEVIKQSLQNEYQGKMIRCAKDGDHESIEKYLKELQQRIDQTQEQLNVITRADIPTMMTNDEMDRLINLEHLTYHDFDGNEKPYLTPHEIEVLHLRKGNLTDEERKEIESHASHSYNFLVQIPWPKDLRGIPEIAHGHHEKLNGKGYPRGLTDEEIVLQAKMMGVCDIFDALTASDRPYKKAASLEEAIKILKMEATDGHLCAELVNIFIREKIYKSVEPFQDAEYIGTHT